MEFCLKYHHKPVNKERFAPFVQKLKDKNQTEKQRKQAFDAASIFYQIEKKKTDQDNVQILNNKNEDISTTKTELESTNTDWSPVYNGLVSEIKLRHYVKILFKYKISKYLSKIGLWALETGIGTSCPCIIRRRD